MPTPLRIETPGYTIRPVGEEALQPLLELYRQCEDFLSLGPDPHPSVEMIHRDLVTTQPDGGWYCGIFEDESQALVGVLDVIPSGFGGNASQAFIELLMIAPAYRNRGLGAAVVQALEAALRGGPARSILAGVQVNNPQAERFWLRQGFQIIREAEPQPDGTVSVMIEKRLSPGR